MIARSPVFTGDPILSLRVSTSLSYRTAAFHIDIPVYSFYLVMLRFLLIHFTRYP